MSIARTKLFLRYAGTLMPFLLMGLIPMSAQAALFTVTSTADNANSVNDPTTLRGAIAASLASPDASDTITIKATGTVSLTQGELLISNPKNIAGKTVTLIGPGAGSFSVSGNGLSGTNLTRVLHITDGTVNLSGVTLTQGSVHSGTSGGAGVLLEGATLTMAHCVVSTCGVFVPNSVGGGIANLGGALILTNCLITGNGDSGIFSAGGIGSENGSLTLQNCTVHSNQGTGLGGGIASSNEICVLTHTALSTNSVSINVNDPTQEGSGGGMYSNNDSLTMADCTISGNQGHLGYGLYIGGTPGKTVHLRGCTLDGNFTTYSMSSYTLVNAGATLDLINCTIAGNSGQGFPAGFYNSGRLTMADCTVAENQGIGLYNDTGGTATVTSTILAGNSIPSVFTATPGAITSGGSNLISDPDGNGFVNDPHHADPNSAGNHDQTGVTHLNLGLLGSNGGPTPTLALSATSPAIDADFADATPTDQRGAARPFGVRNDIGAYEYGATAPTTVIDTYLVTNTNDSGAGSLRQAIADANADSGAIVAFDPSVFGPGKPQTILLTSGPLSVTQSMTITGPGASLLSVSGGNLSRVFLLTGTNTIIMTGLTITNGDSGSQAGSGGGVFLRDSTLTMTDCVISHCTVPVQTGEGGGIFVFRGSATLTRCVITGNSAPNGSGGGIDINSTSFSMTDCTISGNMAKTGGGINFDFTLVSTIATSTISGNTATTGGGINCAYVLLVLQCTIAHNTATNGGGIYGSAELSESTVAYNTATTGGGLDNATASGTAIFSSILAGNTGGNIANASGAVVTSEGYNLIGDPNGNGFTNGVNNDITGVTNPKLGPLKNNGGLTQTIALLSGSPAIDGGQPTTSTTQAGTDQRGQLRPQGAAADIGAYEFGAPSAHDDIYTVKENKPLTVQAPGVLANDTADSTKPTLTATLEDKPLHGSLMFNHDGSFSYTPNTGFLGTDTFTYQVADAGVAGKIGTVTLTVINVSPPTTIATINPSSPNGSNGYYTVPVTITLKATAADNDSSTITTFYSLDGGAQKTYTAPFKVTTDGAHTLTYFSQTAQNGAETAKKATFSIDAAAPVTTATKAAVTGGTQVTLSAKDNLSSIASTVYTIDSGAQKTYSAPFTVTSTTAHTIAYHSTDKAGNVEKGQTVTVASNAVHTFASGLQMFSVPDDYSALTLGQSLIQSGTTSAPTLATWLPSLVNYVLSPTSPADHLRPGQGYWVKLNGTGSLSSMGTPTPTSQPFTITLGEGWNMIGDPFNSTISLANVVISQGSKSYTGISVASSAGVVSYILYSYPAGSTAYVSENGTGSLAPYVGYWVYAFQPCTLTITAP